MPIRPAVISLILVASLGTLQPGAPVRDGTVSLTIGSSDETRDEYMFQTVSGLAFDSAGRIVVTDIKENSVRVYSPEGKFVFRVGGRGAGPGEYQTPIGAAFSRDGLLWIQDEGNRRFNAYALGATAATPRLSVGYDMQPAKMNRFQPIGFDASGNVIGIGSRTDPDDGRVAIRQTVSRDGKVIQTERIAEPPPDSLSNQEVKKQSGEGRGMTISTYYYWQSYGPVFAFAQAPDGSTARAVTSRYDIEWRDAAGRVLRNIRRNVDGPPLSARERKIASDNVDGFIQRAGIPRAQLKSGVPERKVPIRSIAFDQMGRLWVERVTRDSTPREADVYDKSGRQIAVMRWPRDILVLDYRTVAARNNEVLGVATDSLDVERVVRLRLRDVTGH